MLGNGNLNHELEMSAQLTSSQESMSLPLSQETYQSLMSSLFELGSEPVPLQNVTDFSRNLEDALPPSEKYAHVPLPLLPVVQHPIGRASIAAVSDWPGDIDFQVCFDKVESLSKKVNWTFSKTFNRLYVKKGFNFKVHFSTNRPLGVEGIIRAYVVYTEPQHCEEAVKRCPHHSIGETKLGLIEAEHLVRSGSSKAQYFVEPASQRHSVCVPYEDPAAGQNFSTYLYHFPCFNSCPGGPNRRQLTLVFTLEKFNVFNALDEIGRRSFSLKVCACPGRDRATDESPNNPSYSSESSCEPLRKKSKRDENMVIQNVLGSKTSNGSRKKPREYIVKVKDEEMYKFLQEMKTVGEPRARRFLIHMKNLHNLYMLKNNVNLSLFPMLASYFNMVRSSSDEKSEDETILP